MAINAINSLNNISSIASTLGVDKTQNSGDVVNFSDVLNNALSQVNDSQIQAETASNDFAAGKTDDINAVMVTATKADLSLQLALQVRNKLLDAYNEIMRMQI